jgi:hypothetical protein
MMMTFVKTPPIAASLKIIFLLGIGGLIASISPPPTSLLFVAMNTANASTSQGSNDSENSNSEEVPNNDNEAQTPESTTPTEPAPEATPSEELEKAGLTKEQEQQQQQQRQQNEEAAIESQDDSIHPCLLDPSDPVCPRPDPETQDCPAGYAQNEDGNCFLLHPEGCPSGYHGHEDDETGRCIPNDTPCDPGYKMNAAGTNCDRQNFVCDGKPSVVKCEDKNKDDKDNDKDKNLIIKHIHDTKIVKQIVESNDDLGIDHTVVAISYEEGKGINCVIQEKDDNGQCQVFDVTKDPGKEPLLIIIPFV